MTEIVVSATRTRMMSGIRGQDTKPELLVCKAPHARGFRYRVHQTSPPGRPDDIVFPRFRAVTLIESLCTWPLDDGGDGLEFRGTADTAPDALVRLHPHRRGTAST